MSPNASSPLSLTQIKHRQYEALKLFVGCNYLILFVLYGSCTIILFQQFLKFHLSLPMHMIARSVFHVNCP